MSAHDPSTGSGPSAGDQLPAGDALLRIAGRIANFGGWRVDLDAGRVYWSDEVCAIHDEPPGTSPTLEAALHYIVPESRDRVSALFAACVRDGTPYDEEMEILSARGRRVCVRAVGEAVRNASGTVIAVQGAFQDIGVRKARDRALAATEAEFASVFNQAYLLQAILSLGGGLLRANDMLLAACDDADEVIGHPFWDTPWWSWDETVSARIREAVARARDGEVVRLDSDFRTAIGQIRRAELTFARITRADGDPICLLMSGRDITGHELLLQEQDAERQFLKGMLDNVSEGIVACDAAGMLTVFNHAARRMHGLPGRSLLPDQWAEHYGLYSADGSRPLEEHEIPLYRALQGEIVRDVEIVIAPVGTTPHTVRCSGQSIIGANGAQLGAVIVMHDVTAQKQTERALERARRAQRMLSRCNEALIRARTEPELLEAVCRIAVEVGGYCMTWVGYARDDPQRSIEAVAHAGAENGYFSDIRLSWDEANAASRGPAGRTILGGSTNICVDIRTDDSFGFWRDKALKHGYHGVICLPLSDGKKPFGLLGLYSDERVDARPDELLLLEELAANLAFGIRNLRSGVEKARIQAAVVQLAASVSVSASDRFFEELARNMAEALGAQGAAVVRHFHGEPPVGQTVALVLGGERQPDLSYRLTGTPCEHFSDSGECIVTTGATARFPATPLFAEFGVEGYVGRRLDAPDGEVLGHICAFFAKPLGDSVFAASMLGIFATRAAAELQRREADQRLREQASLLDKASDAILVRGIDHRIQFWNQGAARLYGWSAAEAVGRSIESLLYDDPTAFREATGAVIANGVWQGRITQRHRDGRRIVVEGHWTLVTDEHGHPHSILAINTDISARLAMEQRMEQSQRLEAIGQLTGGVAHDFNNLLTVIQGNAELLAEKLVGDARLGTLAEMIGSAAQKGADLTHRLLAVARRQALDPQPVDVNALIRGMSTLLRRTLREDIEFRLIEHPHLAPALVDASELEGALLNLCLNARDAMSSGGMLVIETAMLSIDAGFARDHTDVVAGDYVMVAVSDTGCGIPAEHLDRVFDPFFTTKDFGKGTGLGLSMVYGFVTQSRGYVRIYSEPGQGTTVRMCLPQAVGVGGVPRAPTAVTGSEPSGREHILMVEDDDLVRRHVEAQLHELGYRVTAVSNGPDALERLWDSPDIDLLFTDVIMPGGMNGPQLVEAAHRLRPGLPVLYTSGYTENAIVHQGRLDPDVFLLNKPYRRLELARKLRLVLTAAAAGEQDD